MTPSEKFCKFFKSGLVYNNNITHFTVSPCCYFSKNYVIDPKNDVSSQLLQFQQEWSNENFNDTCRICTNAEKSGLTSYRQSSFDFISSESDSLEFLTIAVNKKCNLACPSCSADSSSFWYQENLRHNIKQPIGIINLHQEDRNGTITKKFLSLLESQDLTKIRYIKFGGGEPLMCDTHEKILTMLPNPEKVTIQYTSNFSIMPSKKILDIWEKFKLIKWVASLDGVKDQFTFLRWPYKWNNLESFVDQAKQSVPGNVIFGVEHTINVLNAFYYPEFLQWFDQHMKENRYGDPTDLNIHKCEGVMSVDHMPGKLRQLVKNKLGNDHAVSVMIDQTTYSHCGDTVRYLDNIDRWRNSNWRGIFPEIQEYLND